MHMTSTVAARWSQAFIRKVHDKESRPRGLSQWNEKRASGTTVRLRRETPKRRQALKSASIMHCTLDGQHPRLCSSPPSQALTYSICTSRPRRLGATTTRPVPTPRSSTSIATCCTVQSSLASRCSDMSVDTRHTARRVLAGIPFGVLLCSKSESRLGLPARQRTASKGNATTRPVRWHGRSTQYPIKSHRSSWCALASGSS